MKKEDKLLEVETTENVYSTDNTDENEENESNINE
jgi:hypothetical protein